ncbi:hypothetical protein, partial [Escherichia coli]
GKNSLNRLIRCVCGKKIGPDPRNFNQRVSLGRNDLLIRTFLSNVFLFHFLNKHVAKTDFYLYIFICKILNKALINHIVNFFTFG